MHTPPLPSATVLAWLRAPAARTTSWLTLRARSAVTRHLTPSSTARLLTLRACWLCAQACRISQWPEHWQRADLHARGRDRPTEVCALLAEPCDLLAEACDLPAEACDLPAEACDLL